MNIMLGTIPMKLAYNLRFLPVVIGTILTIYFFTHWAGVSLPYQDPTSVLLVK